MNEVTGAVFEQEIAADLPAATQFLSPRLIREMRLFSILDGSPRAKADRAGYMAQKVRSETGIGAASASSH